MNQRFNNFSVILTGFGFLFLIYLSACSSLTSKRIQSEIDLIAEKWISDSREAICTITADPGKNNSIVLRGETSVPQIHEEIINTLYKPGLDLTDSIVNLPDTSIIRKINGLVTLSVINLRKNPEHSAELISQAILGTPVKILKENNSWLLVQTPDRYIAWTEKSSITMFDVEEIESWRNSVRVIFLVNSGWVYGNELESEVVGDLVSGSILVTNGKSGNYTKVAFPDGREGVVRSANVKDLTLWLKEDTLSEDRIMGTAVTYLGLPYLWGGSSSKSVDCSGFVQSVYFRNGIILSRDASLQAGHGDIIDINKGFGSLKRGDLLFFGSKKDKRSRVTHVAIYLGDSEFVHASSRVMINSLDTTHSDYSSYRRNSLLSARRIIGVNNDDGIVRVSDHGWY